MITRSGDYGRVSRGPEQARVRVRPGPARRDADQPRSGPGEMRGLRLAGAPRGTSRAPGGFLGRGTLLGLRSYSGFGWRARLGATRGGSLGIFGYTGGHGASIRPFA